MSCAPPPPLHLVQFVLLCCCRLRLRWEIIVCCNKAAQPHSAGPSMDWHGTACFAFNFAHFALTWPTREVNRRFYAVFSAFYFLSSRRRRPYHSAVYCCRNPMRIIPLCLLSTRRGRVISQLNFMLRTMVRGSWRVSRWRATRSGETNEEKKNRHSNVRCRHRDPRTYYMQICLCFLAVSCWYLCTPWPSKKHHFLVMRLQCECVSRGFLCADCVRSIVLTVEDENGISMGDA